MGNDQMKSLAWVKKLVLVFSICLMVVAAGCSKRADSGVSAASDSGASSAQGSSKFTGVPTELTARSLTGAWLGKAVLDQEKFKNKVSQLNAESQATAAVIAKSFLSMAMAMEFHEDGTVENEVEVLSAQGKLLRDGSRATWQVLESNPNGLLVQTQEKRSNGAISTDKMFFQFSGDRNQMAVKVPVGHQLQDCDAMIIFERKTLPPTNVATAPSGTISK